MFFCRVLPQDEQTKSDAKGKKKRARQNALARKRVEVYFRKSLNGTLLGNLRHQDQRQNL